MKMLLTALILCFVASYCQVQGLSTTPILSPSSTTRLSTTTPTSSPSPTTSGCDHSCQNGGTPVCHFGRFINCECPAQFYGKRCGEKSNLRCYKCKGARSMEECFESPRIKHCYSYQSMCYYVSATLSNGQKIHAAGCESSKKCPLLCQEAKQSGAVTSCSGRCCSGDLCNNQRNMTLTSTHATTTNVISSSIGWTAGPGQLGWLLMMVTLASLASIN